MAKGISILLVVVFHAQLGAVAQDPDAPRSFWDWFIFLVGPFRMPLFFLVSGIFASSVASKPLSEVIDRKTWFYLYLFLIWSVFSQSVSALLSWTVGNDPSWPSPAGIAEQFIRPDSVMWFIWALAFLFPLVKLLHPYKTIVTPILVVISILASGNVIEPAHWAYKSLMVNQAFFVLGAWYGADLKHMVPRLRWPILILSTIVFLVFREVTPALPDGVLMGVSSLVTSCGAVAMTLSGLVFLERIAPLRRLGSFFGRRTLPIYVAHSALLAWIVTGLAVLGLPPAGFLFVPLASALAVALSLMLYWGLGRLPVRYAYAAPPLPIGTRDEVRGHSARIGGPRG